MIKEVIVTFDFDSETDSVSNVKCSVGGIEKKKRTTKKIKEVEEEMASEALITLETGKLVFNNKAVLDLELKYEDRIVIKWIKDPTSKTMFPLIGKDISFDEEGSGNKVTKSNTVAYKGKSNAVLAEVGTEFTIENYSEGIWKLISKNAGVKNENIKELTKVAEKIDPVIIVDSDDTFEIEALQFKL